MLLESHQRAHEHLAMQNIRSSRDHHLSIKCCQMGLRSSIPVKTILGIMKLAGITTSIIACENGLGRALV